MRDKVANAINKGLNALWWTLAYSLIALAICISLIRAALPYIAQNQHIWLNWLEENYQIPIRVTNLNLQWQRFSINVSLDHLTLFDNQQQPLVSIDSVHANVDLLQTIWQRQLIFARVDIEHLTSQVDLSLLKIDNSKETVSPQDLTPVIQFLAKQPFVQLTHGEIELLHDAHQTALVELSSISLRNQGAFSQIKGKTLLITGHQQQGAFDFILENTGKQFDLASLNTQIYLSSNRLDMTPLNTYLVDKALIQQGYLTTQVWLHYQFGRWRRLQSHIDLQQLALKNSEQFIPEAQFNLSADQDEQGYRISLRDLSLGQNTQSFPLSELNADFWFSDDFTLLATKIDTPRVELASALAWLKPFINHPLLPQSASGELSHVAFYAKPANNKVQISANLEQVSFQSFKPYPNIHNLSGTLRGNSTHAQLLIQSQGCEIDTQGFMSRPLQLSHLEGQVDWYPQKESPVLALSNFKLSNPDLKLNFDARFTIPSNSPPVLSLYAELTEGNLAHASHYFPVHIMNAHLVEYLTQALQSGQATLTQALVQGELSHFPFEDRTGIFKIQGKTQATHFLFSPDWPRLENISASVFFKGNRMDVFAGNQSVFGAKNKRTHVYIPNLNSKKPKLYVQAEAESDTQHARDFLLNTPLKSILSHLDGLKTQGQGRVLLGLTVDLFKPYHTDISANVRVDNNTIDYLPLNLSMQNVTGEFAINNHGVKGQHLSGRIWQQEASFSFEANNENTHIAVQPLVDLQGPITQWLPSPFWAAASGIVEADIQVDIANNQFKAQVGSNLQGARSYLPFPFDKSAEQIKPLTLVLQGDLNGLDTVKADWQNLFINAQLGDNASIKSLSIGYPNPIILDDASGTYAQLQFSQLSLQDWLGALSLFDFTSAQQKSMLPLLKQLDLKADSLDFHNMSFTPFELHYDAQHRFQIQSPKLQGQFFVDPLTQVLQINVEHAYLTAPERVENAPLLSSSLQPNAIPSIEAQIKHLSIDDVKLDNVYLSATSLNNQFVIHHLSSFSDYFSADLAGKWQVVNNNQQTTLSGRLSSSDIGKMLDYWKIDSGIQQSPATLDINFAWHDSPINMNIFDMDGQASFVLGAGRMEDVDDKGARVFTLLSLSTLNRRLTLDFSDIFEKGFFYDQIAGSISIKDGQAYTDDTLVKGVAADVEIKGRTGLITHDLDHHILVTPKPSASLPLLAAWAINPATGAVVYLLDKIFQPAIKVITRIEYHSTGPWKDIKLVEVNKVEKTVNLSDYQKKQTPEPEATHP